VSDKALQQVKPGELIVIGRGGKALSKPEQRAATVAGFGRAALFGGAVALLEGFLLHSVAIGVAFFAVFTLLMGRRMRAYGLVRAATAHVVADRPDEARALLDPLDRRALHKPLRVLVDRAYGAMAWYAGRTDEALERYRHAALHARGARGVRYLGALSEMTCVLILTGAGRLDEAKRARAALEPQEGEFYTLALRSADLALAFHADEATLLPEDDTLYEWAKGVLGTNRFGTSALFLAWAFEQRGDADMARHMIDEAPARLQHEHVAMTFPRLHAWAEPRLAASAAGAAAAAAAAAE
jgi:hypothetical protein